MSELDALQCFATVSEKRRYVRPEFSADEVEVIDGRHPVVEKVMDHQEYVPNDCQMGKRETNLAHYWSEYVREKHIYETNGIDLDSCANWLFCASIKGNPSDF